MLQNQITEKELAMLAGIVISAIVEAWKSQDMEVGVIKEPMLVKKPTATEAQPIIADKRLVIENEKLTDKDKEIKVTEIMIRLGVPAHIKGYAYIREAIIMAINDIDILSAITKELYPAIAKKFNTTPSRVERAIRHAIEVSCGRGDSEFFYELFRRSPEIKPINSEFIAVISDRIRTGLL